VQTVNRLTIQGESVEIDSKHFVDCTLVDCVLEYSGGDVIFERTEMRGCRHVFFGRARQTLHYLQGVGLMPYSPSEWAEFSEQVH
jgi:hypothetical protein